MRHNFNDKDEKLYRAVYPRGKKPNFWTQSGRLAKAAFKDSKGLSVERTDERGNEDVIEFMQQVFQGVIVSVTVKVCDSSQIHIELLPSKRSKYHCELWRDCNTKLLSDRQQLILALNAVCET